MQKPNWKPDSGLFKLHAELISSASSHLSVCSLPQVQLCETRRELQELKTSVRVTQKEKEQLLAEKQVRHTGFVTAGPCLD